MIIYSAAVREMRDRSAESIIHTVHLMTAL